MIRGLALAVALSAAQPLAAETLFDGRSLTGWSVEMVAENGSTTPSDRIFVADRGVIRVYPDAVQGSAQPHAVLVTTKSWSRYRLTLEYRFTGPTFAARLGQPRDAGVLLHVVPERPGLVAIWHRWPPSLEYQIMEDGTGDAYLLKTRALGWTGPDGGYAPNGRQVTAKLIGRDIASFRLSRAATAQERPGWNRIAVDVDGDRARFWLNGRLVNAVAAMAEDRAEPVPLAGGRIALQAESAGVEYRRIRLTPLRSAARRR